MSSALSGKGQIKHLQENGPRQIAYDRATELIQVLLASLCLSRGKKSFLTKFPSLILRVAAQFKSLEISSNEELYGIANALVDHLKDDAAIMKPFFDKIKDIHVSTLKGENEHIKTLQQALMEVSFSGFETILNVKRRVEMLAAKYKGPAEKKNTWIRLEVEKHLPSMKRKLHVDFIKQLFRAEVLNEDDLYMLLGKIFEDLNEISLYCAFQLLSSLGMYLEYGKSYPGGYSSKYSKPNPKLSPYFDKLSTMIGKSNSCNSLPSDVVSRIQCLIKYRDNKWSHASGIEMICMSWWRHRDYKCRHRECA